MSGRCEKHDNWRAHLGDLIALEQRFDHLRAELAASEALVDALNTQRGVDAAAAMRAVAKAREEQREACARHVARSIGPCEQHDHECEMDRTADDAVDACRATPLDATPLADQFAELDRKFHVLMRVEIERAEKAEARAKELEAGLTSKQGPLLTEHIRVVHLWESLRAERDALKAELAEMRDINLGQVASFRQQRDALKAQVERLTGERDAAYSDGVTDAERIATLRASVERTLRLIDGQPADAARELRAALAATAEPAKCLLKRGEPGHAHDCEHNHKPRPAPRDAEREALLAFGAKVAREVSLQFFEHTPHTQPEQDRMQRCVQRAVDAHLAATAEPATRSDEEIQADCLRIDEFKGETP